MYIQYCKYYLVLRTPEEVLYVFVVCHVIQYDSSIRHLLGHLFSTLTYFVNAPITHITYSNRANTVYNTNEVQTVHT
jgi:hypothetical protein